MNEAWVTTETMEGHRVLTENSLHFSVPGQSRLGNVALDGYYRISQPSRAEKSSLSPFTLQTRPGKGKDPDS